MKIITFAIITALLLSSSPVFAAGGWEAEQKSLDEITAAKTAMENGIGSVCQKWADLEIERVSVKKYNLDTVEQLRRLKGDLAGSGTWGNGQSVKLPRTEREVVAEMQQLRADSPPQFDLAKCSGTWREDTFVVELAQGQVTQIDDRAATPTLVKFGSFGNASITMHSGADSLTIKYAGSAPGKIESLSIAAMKWLNVQQLQQVYMSGAVKVYENEGLAKLQNGIDNLKRMRGEKVPESKYSTTGKRAATIKELFIMLSAGGEQAAQIQQYLPKL